MACETDTPGPRTEINRIISENRIADYPSPNLALGMKPIAFGRGTSCWEWPTQPASVLNPFGFVHGGYLAVFADELFATAIASVLEHDEWAMTAEFKINFLRALSPGPLEGTARLLRRSRSLAFLEAQIASRAGELAVTASATWTIARR